jgi:hypothetical protein
MTHAAEEAGNFPQNPDIFARFRARNELVRTLKKWFGGQGLDVREYDDKVVISRPKHPENGSLHVTLATGEVSHRRVLWDYLGYLPGYGSGHPDEPGVDVSAVTAILIEPGGHGGAS